MPNSRFGSRPRRIYLSGHTITIDYRVAPCGCEAVGRRPLTVQLARASQEAVLISLSFRSKVKRSAKYTAKASRFPTTVSPPYRVQPIEIYSVARLGSRSGKARITGLPGPTGTSRTRSAYVLYLTRHRCGPDFSLQTWTVRFTLCPNPGRRRRPANRTHAAGLPDRESCANQGTNQLPSGHIWVPPVARILAHR